MILLGSALGKAFTAGLSGHVGVMLRSVEIGVGLGERWIGSVPLGGAFVSARVWL